MIRTTTRPDKALPNNIEVEEALLGSILMDNDEILSIGTRSEHFYLERNATIFREMQSLLSDGKPIDMVTLCARLEGHGNLNKVGGSSYIASLLQSVPTASNAKAYADEIEKCYIKRRLIEAACEISGIAYEANGYTPEEVINRAHQALMKVESVQDGSNGMVLYDAIGDFIPEVKEYLEGQRETWGVPTGLIDLDAVIGGLAFGEMTLIAADPRKGKTMLSTTIWLNAGQRGYAGALFSLEMKRRQLMLRLFSERGDVDTSLIRRGKVCDSVKDKMFDEVSKIENLPLWIFDTPMDTTAVLRSILRLQRRTDLKFAIIDYSDLLTDLAESEVVRMKQISHKLKNIAKQTNIALAVVHPITRDASKENEPPELHHLGWGRAWEYDAHTVLFPYFPNQRHDFSANIKIGKYRDGISDKKLPMIFDGKRWKDAARE